jgi:acyl-CoA reductase-like NAD-dependent aldehyde dehydrogenase
MATRGNKPGSPGRNGSGRAVAARAQTSAAAMAGSTAASGRVEVRKTYKLYIGGAFPRTESGRSYVVSAADGTLLANACRASRKDVRDAVRAARKAAEGWAAKTAMNRGQVLYRVAELMEGRRGQFADEVAAAEGLAPAAARSVVDRAIDRWVWYAGWADKIAQVLGSSNPVAAPYFNFTIPEPTGVVGVVAPETSSLLGLVSRLAPPLVTGNAVVLIASERRPLPAVTLAEVLATSDVPGGVVNVLTGRKAELVPVLAAHNDVDALDTWGVPDDMRTEVETLAADDIKRLLRRPTTVAEARFDWLDDAAAERPEWIAAFLEMKTVWHPIGG